MDITWLSKCQNGYTTYSASLELLAICCFVDEAVSTLRNKACLIPKSQFLMKLKTRTVNLLYVIGKQEKKRKNKRTKWTKHWMEKHEQSLFCKENHIVQRQKAYHVYFYFLLSLTTIWVWRTKEFLIEAVFLCLHFALANRCVNRSGLRALLHRQ